MNKYPQNPSEIIDLHGNTISETQVILEKLLKKQNVHIRIITGKGRSSQNGIGVLKNFTKKFLTKNNVRFRQSKINEGGEGSLEVFL